jgi:phenylacetate-CoA oxygenase PaaI subunit
MSVTLTQLLPSPAVPPDAARALLALADDEFMIGHRHSEWLGLSPFLEEDLATASIAQDELGHARALYGLIWPTWPAVEREAGITRRPLEQWASSALADRAGGLWERSLIRHWFYDMLEPIRWNAVAATFGASVQGLQDLVARILVEERYHFYHADSLVRRLTSVADSQARLQQVAPDVVADALHLVGVISVIDEGAGANALELVSAACSTLGLSEQQVVPAEGGDDSRASRMSDVFEQLLQVIAFDPEATW